MKDRELKYLKTLADHYPTIAAASTEIINLQSILNLPKGTEHFMSDLHGEYEAFSHVLRNGSGAVRKKIDDVFGHTLSNSDKRSLATLIYYPSEKMELVKKTRQMGVPVIQVGENYIVGFNREAIDSALKEAGLLQ